MSFGRVWAEVDLDVLSENLNEVRRGIGPSRLLLAIKADAYGHGLREVASEVDGRVDAFGVASIEEGVACRLAGISRTPVLVLSPMPYDAIPLLFEHRLTPCVTEPEFARQLSAEAGRRGVPIGVHVEIDTGMGRTGLGLEEAADAVAAVSGLAGLGLEGVFTHFPAADSDIEFTRQQVESYHGLLAELSRRGIAGFVRHVANTAGCLNLPGSRLDMVRPGLMVYGILPRSYHFLHRATALNLRPVMSLRARIANLRRIPAGRSVSYDRSYFTTRDSLIAVISVGYGDGYPWSLTNKGQAIVLGRRVPVVGNVCMDLTMLDVTDVPGVRIGDTATLLG
ncbi:alanine racemase, partial [candidate division WOR-3 bacterium]|nr:alanine racemase [candidate division WOR-3 bacterium]